MAALKRHPTPGELIQRFGLIRLRRGEWLTIVDTDGVRFRWTAPYDGVFEIESGDLVAGRRPTYINVVRFGQRYLERGRTVYRRSLMKTLWGELQEPTQSPTKAR